MVSPYLDRPLRTHQEVTALRDGQPDLKFFGDGLQQALHNHIAMASFIRQETRRIVGAMKTGYSNTPEMGCDVDMARWNNDLIWLREARRAHSKAILDREAYRQAIREREIQRELRL